MGEGIMSSERAPLLDDMNDITEEDSSKKHESTRKTTQHTLEHKDR
jgi:hypothetical protein